MLEALPLTKAEKKRLKDKKYQTAHAEEIRAKKAARYQEHAAEIRAAGAVKRQENYQGINEKARARTLAWHGAHPEESRRKSMEYALANPERVKAYKRAWYERNSPKVKANAKVWTKEHPDKIKTTSAAWRKKNRPYMNAKGRERRARLVGAPINDFTAEQWREMQVVYDHRCVYCKKQCRGKLTQDHIQPLSKGGSHTYQNIVPSCQSCNSKKHAGPVPIAVQPLLLI